MGRGPWRMTVHGVSNESDRSWLNKDKKSKTKPSSCRVREAHCSFSSCQVRARTLAFLLPPWSLGSLGTPWTAFQPQTFRPASPAMLFLFTVPSLKDTFSVCDSFYCHFWACWTAQQVRDSSPDDTLPWILRSLIQATDSSLSHE